MKKAAPGGRGPLGEMFGEPRGSMPRGKPGGSIAGGKPPGSMPARAADESGAAGEGAVSDAEVRQFPRLKSNHLPQKSSRLKRRCLPLPPQIRFCMTMLSCGRQKIESW